MTVQSEQKAEVCCFHAGIYKEMSAAQNTYSYDFRHLGKLERITTRLVKLQSPTLVETACH